MLPLLSPDPVENDRLWSTVCPVWRTWVTACYHAWDSCRAEPRPDLPVNFPRLLPGTLGDRGNQWFRSRYLILHLTQLFMDEYLPPLTTLEGRDAVLKAARTWGVYPTQEKGDLFIAAAEGGIREEALPLFHQWAEHLSLAWDLCNPIYEDADPVEAVEEAGVALNAWDVMGPTHRDGVLHLYGMDMLREGFTIFRTAGSPSVA